MQLKLGFLHSKKGLNRLNCLGVFLMVFLGGCNSVPVTQEHLELALPEAPEVKMRSVNWEVQDSRICLSPENYSNLSLNTEDIKGFIVYQNKVIKMYKDFYESQDRKDPKKNDKDF